MPYDAESSDASPAAGPRPGQLTALLQDLARVPEGDGAPAWDRVLRTGAVVGRFELLRELGRGGFGVVWEARDRELQRTVAFKAVRASPRRELIQERLLLEAEAAARLSHPNIITLFDVGRTEQGPYLVFELLRGQTLGQRLGLGPMPVPDALRIGIEVAKALAHAHAHGVVHRDLTPGNVFLCEDAQVKLLDLGMAHAFGRSRIEGGTPGYMAPEQEEGAPEDERSDVFALGAILYRMLAGDLPRVSVDGTRRSNATTLEVAGAPALGSLITTMLSARPTERPRSARDVLVALEGIQDELNRSGSHSLRVITRTPRRRSRLLALAAACAIVTVLLVALLARWALTGRVQPEGAPSVAVLPFADLSPERDQAYFAEGIAEEILNALTTVERLRVSGRVSSFSFRGGSRDLAEIGRKLNVSTVLDGSVRRAGNRVRVAAQLVSTRDGFQLWSRTFDRELADVFAVQDDIARSVVQALRIELMAGHEPVTTEYRTPNTAAYVALLRGRRLIGEFSADSLRRAQDVLEESLKADPDYAPAMAWLAVAIMSIDTIATVADPVRRMQASDLADRAVRARPTLPDAFYARGYVRLLLGDWNGAQPDIERALALKPGDAAIQMRYADLLATLGRLPDAIAAALRATTLDPLQPIAWRFLAAFYNAVGNHRLAEQAADRALEAAPRNVLALREKAFSVLLDGRAAQALTLFENHPTEYMRLTGIALAQHTLRKPEESRRALELLKEVAPSSTFQIAQIYAWGGDADGAFEWLEKAYAVRDPGIRYVKYDPFLRGIRADSRYPAFLRRIDLPVD